MYVNTRTLELAGLLRPGINHPGVELGQDGLPDGVLKGPEVYMPVGIHAGFSSSVTDTDEEGLRDFARLCVRSGTTTATDLAAQLSDSDVQMMLRVTADPEFPVRVVPFKLSMGHSPGDLVNRTKALRELATDMLRLGHIKVIADGSIQGFTARLRWPGYFNGSRNGLWYIVPEQMAEIYCRALHEGIMVHTHTNGDEATQLALDMLGSALFDHPRRDHRFTLQHCQLADAAQFRRMRTLGVCVNLFANHHFYWGDEHRRLTVGPERAERMNACRTALDTGVPMAIHSDAPVTPLGPLFTAWCAVNRVTSSGHVQGASERITVSEALHAITLGAAYTLQLDGEIGSIEVGKRADFAVLNEDPTATDPSALKDVPVWGTVQGGRLFAADGQ